MIDWTKGITKYKIERKEEEEEKNGGGGMNRTKEKNWHEKQNQKCSL